MFELSQPMSFATPIASLSRVFLNPLIPGWVSPEGIVQLPLTLGPQNSSIGIHWKDDRAFTEWVNDHRDRFASVDNEWDLYGNEMAFQNAVRPPWLGRAQQHIDQTINAYAQSERTSFRLRRTISLLQSRWSEIQTILSGILYAGNPSGMPHYTLFPQDLCLFGPAIGYLEPAPVIDLLKTCAHVNDLIRMGMTDRIEVISEDGDARRLHDAVEHTGEPWLTVLDGDGNARCVAKNNIRPLCSYELDDEGRINPFAERPSMIPGEFDLFQKEITQRIALFGGAYLLAHFRIGDEETTELNRLLRAPFSRGADGIAEAGDVLIKYLEKTGRRVPSPGSESGYLLATALRQIGETV